MDFVKFVGQKMGIMIGMEEKTMKFWVEYNLESKIGTYHDNSQLQLKWLDGMLVKNLTETAAIELLKEISAATRNTAASRYSDEIDQLVEELVLNPFNDWPEKAILTFDGKEYCWEEAYQDPHTGEWAGRVEDSAANEMFGETENYYTVPAVLVNGDPIMLPWKETLK